VNDDRTIRRYVQRLNAARRLKRQLKRAGITQDTLADAAGIGRTAVCHVLAGRATSSNVLATAKRLLAAQTRNGKASAA
jgi:transcriptional regulator with XRE-family HTH domain